MFYFFFGAMRRCDQSPGGGGVGFLFLYIYVFSAHVGLHQPSAGLFLFRFISAACRAVRNFLESPVCLVNAVCVLLTGVNSTISAPFFCPALILLPTRYYISSENCSLPFPDFAMLDREHACACSAGGWIHFRPPTLSRLEGQDFPFQRTVVSWLSP